MTLLQIEYFLAVAEQGGFTRAAELLYTSQPTITQQIKSLEKELGFSLFTRSFRNATLTDPGQIIFDCFRKFKTDYEISLAEAKRVCVANDEVTIGFLTTMDMGVVAQSIKEYCLRNEKSKTVILVAALEQLLEKLQSGEVDIAFLFDNQVCGNARFRFVPIFKSERKLILSVGHPLAVKPDLTPADFLNEQFIARKPGSKSVLDMHEKIFAALGLRGVSTLFVSNVEEIFSMVDGGFGVAIADEHSTLINDKKFRICDTGYFCEMGIVCLNENQPSSVRDLIQWVANAGIR
jgi:DNA-binding transcriptional LysR family regulator